MVKDYIQNLTEERMLKLIEYARRPGYLPLEEDLITPWTVDGITCNELRAAADEWVPNEAFAT